MVGDANDPHGPQQRLGRDPGRPGPGAGPRRDGRSWSRPPGQRPAHGPEPATPRSGAPAQRPWPSAELTGARLAAVDRTASTPGQSPGNGYPAGWRGKSHCTDSGRTAADSDASKSASGVVPAVERVPDRPVVGVASRPAERRPADSPAADGRPGTRLGVGTGLLVVRTVRPWPATDDRAAPHPARPRRSARRPARRRPARRCDARARVQAGPRRDRRDRHARADQGEQPAQPAPQHAAGGQQRARPGQGDHGQRDQPGLRGRAGGAWTAGGQARAGS